MDDIRFGIIGAGQIAHCCCTEINEHAHASVIAAADPHPGRVAELCEANAIEHAYSDGCELIADPNVDAVYIAVPNAFHAPLAKAALEGGKHVILDKPFALNLDEARMIAAAAEGSGKQFMLGMNQRYRADSQKIRALVAQNVLGEIYHAKAYWFRRSGIPRFGTWFCNKDLSGGGALLDIGVHLLDLCLHTMDNFEPVTVLGRTYSKFGNRGIGEGSWGKSDSDGSRFDVDDFACAMIRMANGATVTLDVSWAIHSRDANRMNVDICGTEGGASLYPAELSRFSPESWRDGYEVLDDLSPEIPYPHENRFHNFINALRGEEELCCSIDQALVVQSILDAIYESCRSGGEVRLD
ncbi:MAG: putative dehydrogenase [Rhodothermales bacterium]|jgi:predicted dehydrogenase